MVVYRLVVQPIANRTATSLLLWFFILGFCGINLLFFIDEYTLSSPNFLPYADNGKILVMEQNGSPYRLQKKIRFVYAGDDETEITSIKDMCCIESAAKLHPRSRIEIHTNKQDMPLTKEGFLGSMKNVHFLYLDFNATFEDTPLEEWWKSEKWVDSPHKAVHLSDAWRNAILWKEGGVYLDNDLLLLKNIDRLQNVIGDYPDWPDYEPGIMPNNAIMIFDAEFSWLDRLMQRWVREYNPTDRAANGPRLMIRDLKANDIPPQLTIAHKKYFYEIHWTEANLFFEPLQRMGIDRKNRTMERLIPSYGAHLFAGSRTNKIGIGERSVFEDLMARFCPETFRIYLDERIAIYNQDGFKK